MFTIQGACSVIYLESLFAMKQEPATLLLDMQTKPSYCMFQAYLTILCGSGRKETYYSNEFGSNDGDGSEVMVMYQLLQHPC